MKKHVMLDNLDSFRSNRVGFVKLSLLNFGFTAQMTCLETRLLAALLSRRIHTV